uniref:GPI-anchor transamidase n=1 Tax=Chromera velia CCMP2878 TaxID=1169474 RepID=A0A0G4FYE0_9ALVE|eukprot:Cvel_19243.t1-p1 / transcript=Cvel_19243.t1 / gene=Cvel_19243 / organism=Chromera_velia_CCMP2878 / gene_product=hypothetical protein / transcript_product=hypothetical protein / location=Cvel_scaffold1645:33766-34860(-) / protein_length=365 / sequence_SO=supercontig / SO=protein_coding / is_pseudo=false
MSPGSAALILLTAGLAVSAVDRKFAHFQALLEKETKTTDRTKTSETFVILVAGYSQANAGFEQDVANYKRALVNSKLLPSDHVITVAPTPYTHWGPNWGPRLRNMVRGPSHWYKHRSKGKDKVSFVDGELRETWVYNSFLSVLQDNTRIPIDSKVFIFLGTHGDKEVVWFQDLHVKTDEFITHMESYTSKFYKMWFVFDMCHSGSLADTFEIGDRFQKFREKTCADPNHAVLRTKPMCSEVNRGVVMDSFMMACKSSQVSWSTFAGGQFSFFLQRAIRKSVRKDRELAKKGMLTRRSVSPLHIRLFVSQNPVYVNPEGVGSVRDFFGAQEVQMTATEDDAGGGECECSLDSHQTTLQGVTTDEAK